MSIIVFIKSKKAGVQNGIALAGIIVGSITTLMGIIGSVIIVDDVTYMLDQCSDSSKSVYIDKNYKLIKCVLNPPAKNGATVSPTSNNQSIDIKDTLVSVVGGKVDSTCWSFDMPEGYKLHGKSISCQARVFFSDALGSVTVQPQTGDITIQSAKESINKLENDGAKIYSQEVIKVDGKDTLKVVHDDPMGLKSDMYIVIDNSKKFSYEGDLITSYMITGYSYNDALAAITDGVVSSFVVK